MKVIKASNNSKALSRINEMMESLEKFIRDIDDNTFWFSTKMNLSDASSTAHFLSVYNNGKEITSLGDSELVEKTKLLCQSIESVWSFTAECNDLDLMEYRELERHFYSLKNTLAKKS